MSLTTVVVPHFNDGSAQSFAPSLHSDINAAIVAYRNGDTSPRDAFLCYAADVPVSMGIIPRSRSLPPCTGAPHTIRLPLSGAPSSWSPLSIAADLLDAAAAALTVDNDYTRVCFTFGFDN